MTLAVRLPLALEKRLNALAKKTHRSKSSFVCQALEEYLEDQEDYYAAVEAQKRLDAGLEKTYTLEEAMKMWGITEDDLKDVDNNELEEPERHKMVY